MEIYPCLWIRVFDAISPTLNEQEIMISIQILTTVFAEIGKSVLKFIWKFKIVSSQDIPEEPKGHVHPNFKSYYKVKIIKTVWYQQVHKGNKFINLVLRRDVVGDLNGSATYK